MRTEVISSTVTKLCFQVKRGGRVYAEYPPTQDELAEFVAASGLVLVRVERLAALEADKAELEKLQGLVEQLLKARARMHGASVSPAFAGALEALSDAANKPF